MRLGEEVRTDNGFKQIQLFIKKSMTGTYPGFFKGELQGEGTYQIVMSFLPPFEGFIRNDLEIHETRNMSDRNRRFGASCAIIKVT